MTVTAVIRTIDAFYLGNDLPEFDTGDKQRAFAGTIFSPTGANADRTVSVTEFSYRAKQYLQDDRYPVDVYIGEQERNYNIDSWVQHGVATGDTGRQDVLGTNFVTVDFVTKSGTFIAVNMDIVQTVDGHTFMVPVWPGTNGFNDYDKMVQGKEILSFSIRALGTQSHSFTPPPAPWTDGAFPDVDPQPNQIVDGENTGEIMNPGYDDSNAPTNSGGDIIDGADGVNDVILGNGGNDTINAGQGVDEVYGGSGNDTINGGAGNDILVGDFAKNVKDVVVDNGTVNGNDVINGGAGDDVIYGDSNEDLSGQGSFTGPRESFNWDLVSSTQVDSSVVQDTGDVKVTYTRTADTGKHESDVDNATPLNTTGIDSGNEVIDTNSSLESVTNGNGNKGAFQWQFDKPVGNVEFNVNDLDGSGVVTIKAYSPDGTETEVQLVGGTNITTNGNVASNNGGGYQETNDPDVSFQVTIPGPVSRIELVHDQRGDLNSGINVTDMYFDTGFVPSNDGQNGQGGDDVITGGAGADKMFGEGGDDTFIVASAAEGAGDVIVGGNGPNQATDNDILDLRGAGPVSIVDTADTTDAGARTGTVTFGNGATLQFSQIETILQDAPVLTITPAPGTPLDPNGNPETIENGQPVNIVITRTGPTDQSLTVTLTSNDPTEATVPQTVTIPAGQSSVTVPVTPVDDPLVDGTQFPVITATAPGFAPVQETVAVKDDDVAPTTITITPAPGTPVDDEGRPVTTENGAPAKIVVSLDAPALVDTVVTLTNGDPSEINPPLTVTIPAGQTSVVVDVPSVDDPDVDGTQIAPITASAPGLTSDTIEVAVRDDDVPTLTITPAPGTPVDGNGNPETSENGDPVTLVITRTGPTDEPLVVTLSTNDPSEITGPQTVIIPAGQDSVTFDVTPVDDPLVDGTQFPVITATAPGFTPVEETVAVKDDDVPPTTITITPAPGTPVDDEGRPVTTENGAPAKIVVSLDAPALVDTVVTLTNGDPSEINPPLTVTIPAGQTSVVVDVPSVDDPDVDGTQIAPITASAPGLTSDTIEVAVRDDDVPTLTITPAPGTPVDDNGNPVTSENGDPVDVVITRNGPLDEELVVTLGSNDPTEATAPQTVIIPAGQASVTVPVTPVDDPDVDGDQTPIITATAPGFEPVSQPVVVQDDDVPTLTITPAPGTPVDDNGNPVTSENGDPVDVVITRNGPLDEELVVTLGSNDPTEATAPQTVIIPAGQASVTVPVTPVDDPDVDGDQTPIITATAPGFTPATQPVVVLDDDVANRNPDAKDDNLGQFTVDTPAPIDVAKVLSNDSDPDGDPLTITGVVGTTNGRFDFVNGVPSFIPEPGFVGTASLTYGVEDGKGGTDTATIFFEFVDKPVLTITPAPGTPTDPNGNPVTSENGQPVDVVITRSGPTDQPLTVTLSSNDPTEASAPQTVIIPAGQSSVTIPVTPVDDPLVDGTQFPVISASAPGFTPATQSVVVLDDDVANRNPDAKDDNLGLFEADKPAAIDVAKILSNDSDPDGDPLTITGVVGSTNGHFEFINGVPSFVPNPGFVGTASLTYGVSDGKGGTDTATIFFEFVDKPVLIITPAPGTPTDDNGNPVTSENGQPVDVVVTRTGPTDQPLTVTLSSNDPTEATVPQTVTIPAGQTSVTVTVTPIDDPLVDGTQFPSIRATAPGFDPVVEVVTVLDDDVPNRNPIAGDDNLGEFKADTPAPIDVALISSNDTDPDGDPVEITGVVGTTNGRFDFVNGVPSFIPDPGFVGTASLTYSVSDGKGGTDTATIFFKFVAGEPNQAPIANDDTIDTPSTNAMVINPAVLLANDTDPNPNDTIRLQSVGNPVNGTVAIDPATGNVIFTPAANYCGPASFTYVIVDQGGLTSEATVNLTIADNIINGTNGNDVINGTNGSDIINGLDGEDNIHGNDGADCISGGGGSDRIEGGNGNDEIFGNQGNDTLKGNAGDDTIYGNSGNDLLLGQEGNDTLYGNQADDTIDGGAGNDIIQGGQNNDVLTGGLGADTFVWTGEDIQPFGNGREVDIITDFNTSEDKLDLADLLLNEENSDNLDRYLDFSYDSTTGDTTIAVSALGSFEKGDDAIDCQQLADQLIILKGLDLTGGNTIPDENIIQNMLNNNILHVDL